MLSSVCKTTTALAAALLFAWAPSEGLAKNPSHPGLALNPLSLPGGGHPFALATGDLNGDGFVDVAVTNPGFDSVSVYLGRGDGSFAGPSNFATGRNPRAIVAGDFNGDGHPDLGVGSTADGVVAVHDGRGDGSFASARKFRVGDRPFLGSAADLNGDGFLDLAIANEVAKVSVLLGDGQGSFSVESYTTDKWPSDVTAGDFNADGHADLAVSNWGANNVSVLLGAGDGRTFAPPRNFTFKGHSLYSVEAADVDRDGHLDMVWNDIMRNGMYVLYGNGRGDFPRRALLPAGAGVRSVIAADLTGDGWLDLAGANTHAGSVSLALADGKGGFFPSQDVPVGVRPRMVAAADVNGDGRPDLIVTNIESNSISVLINEATVDVATVPELMGPPLSKKRIEVSGLAQPQGLALSPNGDLLIADRGHHRIARVRSGSTTIETLAGTGQAGDWGDHGPAIEAGLNLPSGVTVDSSGNVYVADSANHRVRKVDVSGTITTIAGTGGEGFSGDGEDAMDAQLTNPLSLALDDSGNLYIGEMGRVRRVDPAGRITTVAGGPFPGAGGDGGPAVETTLGASIPALAVDRSGNLLILDQINGGIRKLAPSGTIDTIAGGGKPGETGPSIDPKAAYLGFPTGLAVDGEGTLFVSLGTAVLQISPRGTIAKKLESAEGTTHSTTGLTVDQEGNLFVADQDCNCVQKLSASGTVMAVAGQPPLRIQPAAHGRALDESVEPTPRFPNARLHLDWEHKFRSGSDANAPYAVAVGQDDSVYIAGDVGSGVDLRALRLDGNGDPVWQYDSATPESELGAALTLTPDEQVVVAGYETSLTGSESLILSLTTSGKENWRYIDQARGHQAANGIASDASSNLYIAGESEQAWRIISLSPKGALRWTYDGGPGAARAIALDRNGDLVVAGSSAQGWRVIKLTTEGKVVWERESRSPGRSVATAVAVDRAGDILAAGAWRDKRDIFRVEKWSSGGQSLWAYADQAGGLIARGIAIDSSGTIVAVGESDVDWVLLGLDADANLLWRFQHDGGGGRINPDQAFAVASHPDGGFVVTGLVHPRPPKLPNLGPVDWRIARYRVETGNP